MPELSITEEKNRSCCRQSKQTAMAIRLLALVKLLFLFLPAKNTFF